MLRQSATDQEIKNRVWQEHRLKVEIAWIADCKQHCGIPVEDVRAFQQARFSPCPPEKRPAIKQAFRHFGMLPPQPFSVAPRKSKAWPNTSPEVIEGRRVAIGGPERHRYASTPSPGSTIIPDLRSGS